jgi:hypothetical protein
MAGMRDAQVANADPLTKNIIPVARRAVSVACFDNVVKSKVLIVDLSWVIEISRSYSLNTFLAKASRLAEALRQRRLCHVELV